MAMLTRGMPGTSMPSWKHLDRVDLESLVLFLKNIAPKFEKYRKKGKLPQPITTPPPPPFNLESVSRGKDLFLSNCSGCHGVKGRGDGDSTHKIVNIASDAIRPRNLSKPWTFRNGRSRRALFNTIRTGLSTTAMPRFSTRIHNDQNIWDIVYYVQTLSPPIKPTVKKTLLATKFDEELPLNVNDVKWKQVKDHFIPLGGQIISGKKAYFPTVDNIWLKAAYNDDEIAILLRWDDPSVDPGLIETEDIKLSPPPPLPPGMEDLLVEEDTTVTYERQPLPDVIALQFPLTSAAKNGGLPYFLNGDRDHPVNLWKWSSHLLGAIEQVATGMGKVKIDPEGSQAIDSKISYRYGQYNLLLKRKLKTFEVENDVQFDKGIVPIAVNVWDGSEGETGSQKSISSWYQLELK